MSQNVDPFLNPIPLMENLKGKSVIVKLKWGHEYKGTLLNYDDYFNIQMKNVEEWMNDQLKGSISEILIRCNNVLYIRENSEENI